MNDRPSERDAGGGGLTGATGDLVPPDPTDELVTGERREVDQMEQSPSASEAAVEPGEERQPAPMVGTDERGAEPDRF